MSRPVPMQREPEQLGKLPAIIMFTLLTALRPLLLLVQAFRQEFRHQDLNRKPKQEASSAAKQPRMHRRCHRQQLLPFCRTA